MIFKLREDFIVPSGLLPAAWQLLGSCHQGRITNILLTSQSWKLSMIFISFILGLRASRMRLLAGRRLTNISWRRVQPCKDQLVVTHQVLDITVKDHDHWPLSSLQNVHLFQMSGLSNQPWQTRFWLQMPSLCLRCFFRKVFRENNQRREARLVRLLGDLVGQNVQ